MTEYIQNKPLNHCCSIPENW